MAQLVARLVRIEEVRSSNLLSSTNKKAPLTCDNAGERGFFVPQNWAGNRHRASNVHQTLTRTRSVHRRKIYDGPMQIIGTLETIETGAIETTTAECLDYHEGFEAMRRIVPEGDRLLSVIVER
jgi:hypothetical protein